MKTLERLSITLEGDASRVLGRIFIPGEESLIEGTSRIPQVLKRALAMDEHDVERVLAAVEREFSARHRDLSDQFLTHFKAVESEIAEPISEARKLLIGAFFTQEYAIEAAAYFNPSVVPHPNDDGVHDSRRFVLSVRAVGEGHISTVVFRTGRVQSDGRVFIDSASPFVSMRATRFTVIRKRFLHETAVEDGIDSADLEIVLAMLPDKFTAEELIAALTQLDLRGLRNDVSARLMAKVHEIARSGYEVDFPDETELSERVLWPTAPDERRGMEDARFVRMTDSREPARYRGSYTAFDGHQVVPRVLETDDFSSFSSSSLTGPGAKNKGIAFFPRRIGDRFCALSRSDRESNSITYSEDGYHWNHLRSIDVPKESWELVHSGNCGSPIETDAGWLALTHGAGAMRQYAIGAMLLDLENPHRVIGRLREPLLRPELSERDGYVPNVVYSCGGMIHADRLVIPYGMSDCRIGFASVEVDELIGAMSPE